MTKNQEGLVNAIVHRDYYEEGSGIYAFYRLGITEKMAPVLPWGLGTFISK